MSWNETTETETFDLDAAVAEHVERAQQETRRRKEQEAYEAEVYARRGRVDARQRLEAALPAIVRETLRLGEPIYHNGVIEVRLTINDEPWTLWGYDSSTWIMYAPDDVMRQAEDEDLLDGLVAAVADYRERSVNRAIAEREEAEKRLRQAEEHHKPEVCELPATTLTESGELLEDTRDFFHTPGPWRARQTHPDETRIYTSAPDDAGRLIAAVLHFGSGAPDDFIANGRLMTAAPMLLEALAAILTEWGETERLSPETVQRATRAIVAAVDGYEAAEELASIQAQAQTRSEADDAESEAR